MAGSGYQNPNVYQGQAIGGGLAAHDSTALAALPIQGMSVGTTCFNLTVGSNFILTVSTAALVTDQVVAVSGITGLRWIKAPAQGLSSVVAGTGISVNNTDPLNPVVSMNGNPPAALSATTATAVTSLAIDVTALGDGDYAFEFDGTLSSGAKKLKIQANSSDLASAQGNSIQFAASGAVGTAATETTGVVINAPADTTPSAFCKGRFSSRNGKLSSLSSQFVGFGAANWSGISCIGYTPAAVLTNIAITSTVASGITSGTFYVTKLSG